MATIQLGAQFSTGDKVNPTLTFQAFPINLGLDLGRHLTLSFATGGLVTYNLEKKELAAGIGLSFGISAKSSIIEDLFVVPPLF